MEIKTKDTITIKMEPAILNLFWDEEGTAIGDSESISINEHYEVKLNIQDLQEWLWEYENQCLIPCETGEIGPRAETGRTQSGTLLRNEVKRNERAVCLLPFWKMALVEPGVM